MAESHSSLSYIYIYKSFVMKKMKTWKERSTWQFEWPGFVHGEKPVRWPLSNVKEQL